MSGPPFRLGLCYRALPPWARPCSAGTVASSCERSCLRTLFFVSVEWPTLVFAFSCLGSRRQWSGTVCAQGRNRISFLIASGLLLWLFFSPLSTVLTFLLICAYFPSLFGYSFTGFMPTSLMLPSRPVYPSYFVFLLPSHLMFVTASQLLPTSPLTAYHTLGCARCSPYRLAAHSPFGLRDCRSLQSLSLFCGACSFAVYFSARRWFAPATHFYLSFLRLGFKFLTFPSPPLPPCGC